MAIKAFIGPATVHRSRCTRVQVCARKRYTTSDPEGREPDANASLDAIRNIERRLRAGLHAQAERMFLQEEFLGKFDEQFALERMIALFGALHSVSWAEKIFERYMMRFGTDISAANVMMRIYADNGMSTEALRLHKRLPDMGIEPTQTTLEQVMRSCLEDRPADAQEVLREMYERFRSVRAGCLGMMARAHRNDIQALNALWTWAVDINATLSEGDVVELVNVLSENGGHDTAESILSMLPDLGLTEPYSSGMIVSMVRLYSSQRKSSEIQSCHALARDCMLSENVDVLNALACGYLRSDELDLALEAVASIRQTGESEFQETTIALLDYYARVDRPEDAKEVFESMNPIDLQAVNIYLEILASVADGEGAERVYQQLRREKIRPDVRTHNAILRAKYAAGDYSSALKQLRRMNLAKVAPNKDTYGVILSGHSCGSAPSAVRLHLQRVVRKKQMSAQDFGALVRTCCRPLDAVEVEKRLHRLALRGRVDELTVWNLALFAHARQRNGDHVRRILRRMKRNRVPVSDQVAMAVRASEQGT